MHGLCFLLEGVDVSEDCFASNRSAVAQQPADVVSVSPGQGDSVVGEGDDGESVGGESSRGGSTAPSGKGARQGQPQVRVFDESFFAVIVVGSYVFVRSWLFVKVRV